MRGKLIHSVVGDAVTCGPCALSSLLGVPASTWEDRGMENKEFEAIALAAGAIRLPHSDFAIGGTLAAFGNRHLDACAGGRYNGAWLLLLGMGDKVHAVAVDCLVQPYRRWFVDNLHRSPVSFSSLRAFADSGWLGTVGVAWRWPVGRDGPTWDDWRAKAI